MFNRCQLHSWDSCSTANTHFGSVSICLSKLGVGTAYAKTTMVSDTLTCKIHKFRETCDADAISDIDAIRL